LRVRQTVSLCLHEWCWKTTRSTHAVNVVSPNGGWSLAGNMVRSLAQQVHCVLPSSQQQVSSPAPHLQDKCYGFVTLGSQTAAEQAIHTLNGQTIGGGTILRVNYALVPQIGEDRERTSANSSNGESASASGGGRGLQPQHQIFVGDLSADVDDFKLYNSFAQFTSCV